MCHRCSGTAAPAPGDPGEPYNNDGEEYILRELLLPEHPTPEEVCGNNNPRPGSNKQGLGKEEAEGPQLGNFVPRPNVPPRTSAEAHPESDAIYEPVFHNTVNVHNGEVSTSLGDWLWKGAAVFFALLSMMLAFQGSRQGGTSAADAIPEEEATVSGDNEQIDDEEDNNYAEWISWARALGEIRSLAEILFAAIGFLKR